MAKKILIVDDDTFMRTLLRRTLMDLEDNAGVELLVAKDGQAALEIIKDERPELILLDVMMPEMDGFDVCYAVKHDLKLEDITIVMLTAKGQEVDKQRGAEVGADRYVTKPFDPDELLHMAVEILGLDYE